MWSIILKIIGLLLVLCGVTLIFDARIITKRFFGFERRRRFQETARFLCPARSFRALLQDNSGMCVPLRYNRTVLP